MNPESDSPPAGTPPTPDAHGHSHGHDCGCGHEPPPSAAALPVAAAEKNDSGHQHHHEGCDHDHKHDDACCGGHGHAHHHHDHDHHHHHDDAAAAETERRFFFSLESLVLLMWAGALLYFVTSGRVVHFLAPTGWFREQALVGGLILGVVALFNWLMRNRFPGCGHDHGHEHDENGHCPAEHEHHHHHEEATWLGRAVTILLLAAPVSLAVAYAPNDWSDAYKAQLANSLAASNAPVSGKSALTPQNMPPGENSYTIEDLKKQVDLSPDGNFILPITSLWSVAGDAVVRPVISGQQVETIGQIVKDSFNPARLRAFELMVSCCAADARPVSFPLDFGAQKLPDYREMGWYKIVGTVGFEDERGGKVTVLNVKSITPWTRPNSAGPMY